MSDQMPLWVKGSETSRAAAVSIAPRLNELQGVVMSYIAGRGQRGATDEEITRDLKMNPSTARPRRIELVEMGKIRSAGRTRPTVSGRSATVWVVHSARGQPLTGRPPAPTTNGPPSFHSEDQDGDGGSPHTEAL